MISERDPSAPTAFATQIDSRGRDWAAIRGFNYQPSYASSALEVWRQFDAGTIEVELTRGKKYFPGMNALRLWLSWDAYLRDPKRYLQNFERALQLADQAGCAVIAMLFNRWHDFTLDFGGIYNEHFHPATPAQLKDRFGNYLESLVGAHRNDPRILAWDLCNEPKYKENATPEITDSEIAWLQWVHGTCKSVGATAPTTLGLEPATPLEVFEPICDVLSIHPYWFKHDAELRKILPAVYDFGFDEATFEQWLDAHVAFARKVKKPLMANECCWGDVDDERRVAGVRYTLTQLKKRHIGWTIHLLHHSLVADAHRAEFGPVGAPGVMHFIEADGSLRAGHDVFNEF